MDSNTNLYGLIGHPIKHSLSPEFQNALIEMYNKNAVYLAFDISPNNFANIKNLLITLNIKGINITIPYKEKIIEYLDELDISTKNIRAVNTIKNINGKLIGYNTDVIGFKRLIERNNIPIENLNIAVLGAGGAARAVLSALAMFNCNEITIYNRTYKNAKKILDDLKLHKISVKNLEDLILDDNMLVINTTSVGLNENDTLINIEKYYNNSYFVDLIYNPVMTKFLKQAKDNNMPIINGLSMLINQGVESFNIWHNIKVNENTINKLITMISQMED